MASSKLLYDIVGDVTECPICTEVIVDSKVLPCIHTFCLKCLEQFWKDKKPGDQVPCPLCRTPFNIPEGGLSGLPKNCFVEKLLDAQKLSSTNQSIPTCDLCSNLCNDEHGFIPPAAKYCVDCESNMCEQCSKLHSIIKSLKEHHVVKLGEVSTLDTSMKYALIQCKQHKDEKIEIYCLDCETAVCQTCFIIKHNGHECSDIDEVAQSLKDQIRENIEKINEMFLKVGDQSGNLETGWKDFDRDAKEAEAQIIRRGDEIKQLVDKHVQSLLQELNEEKTRKLKEFENVREELQVQKISLESFMKYSQRVLDKANPSEIACSASEIRTRADNLLKMMILPVGRKVKVLFVPSDLIMFTDGSNARNIVGKTNFSEKIPSDSKPFSDGNNTKCIAKKNLFKETNPTDLNMFTENSSAGNVSGKTSFRWTIPPDPKRLSYSKYTKTIAGKTSFKDGFLGSSSTIRNKNAILANNLEYPSGITISDTEIFIVQCNKREVLQVFDYGTFKHLRNISVPALKDAWDITFSENILFVTERWSGLIHRVPLNSSEPKNSWSAGSSQLTLSTLKSGNILVTCYNTNKIIEYTTTGQFIREIPQSQDITNPLHAIQMENNRFLVGHMGNLNRVCLIDNKGQLVKSYGATYVSGSEQLTCPNYLVTDVNGSCLVVDYGANRIILLNAELQFVKELIPPSGGLKYPFRMCLDRNRKKLFVAEFINNGRVVVFDFLP